MDKVIDLGSGLELLVMNNTANLAGHPRVSHLLGGHSAAGLLPIEQLQHDVFAEQGMSPRVIKEKILGSHDMIGTSGHYNGATDGTSPYHGMFLFMRGRLIGMAASELTKLPDIGLVVMWITSLLLSGRGMSGSMP